MLRTTGDSLLRHVVNTDYRNTTGTRLYCYLLRRPFYFQANLWTGDALWAKSFGGEGFYRTLPALQTCPDARISACVGYIAITFRPRMYRSLI